MSIFTRARIMTKAKTNAMLDAAENPVDMLAYAEEQQRELLRKVGQGLIEVATARQRLIKKAETIRAQIPKLEDQAARSLEAEREDLARIALQRKHAAAGELAELDAQIAEVTSEETALTTAHQQLALRAEAFQHRRVTAVARFESATARVQVSDAITGVSGELADLSMAIGRAEEKTARLQSRAVAIDGLIAAGVFSGALTDSDRVERELREIATARAVDADLASLRTKIARPA